MTFEDFYKSFEQENFTKSSTIIAHFRYATHGLKDAGNTHPFTLCSDYDEMRKVEDSVSSVLIHNGIISNVPRHDVASDTMVFTRIISRLDRSDPVLNEYINSIASGSKVLILHSNGAVETFGSEWIKDNGVFYSNNGYMTTYARAPIVSSAYAWYKDRYGSI